MTDDEAFRRVFNSLRAEDVLRAPSFDAIVTRRARPVRPLRLGLALSTLIVLLAVIALEVGRRPITGSHRDSSPFILAWTAPTDFLLDTPGSQLMRNVPQIGNASVPAARPSATPAMPAEPHVISLPERFL